MPKFQGRRFIGPNGEDLAASKIQATFKAYRERLRYLDYRRRKWAAGVIAISWGMNVKMAKVRKQLVDTRKDQLGAFRIKAKVSRYLHVMDFLLLSNKKVAYYLSVRYH